MKIDERTRRRVPRPVKDAVKTGMRGFGTATSRFRGLPDFVILGAQRAGTTSLFRYLCQHPSVVGSSVKEVHYFDNNVPKGQAWYRSHFPTNAFMRATEARSGSPVVTGEASPYYLFHPAVPRRIAEELPQARFIVLLRDPVDRLVSHHRHELELGFESEPLERALELEPRRLEGQEEFLLSDPAARSFAHQHHSYLARGRYAEQLERWFGEIERERFLIVISERFFADPAGTFHEVERFLGLPPTDSIRFRQHNAVSYAPIGKDLRRKLRGAYAPYDDSLQTLLGDDPGWKT
jgi:hypothetical protein